VNIYDIRRINLRILAGRYKTQKELADLCKWKAPYISQMLHGSSNIGTDSARRIERATGMPDGWMDSIRDLLTDPKRGLRQAVTEELLPISDAVSDGRLNESDLRILRQLAEHLMECKK
jgi:transcriptional regulator with XRE-family HTH domain